MTRVECTCRRNFPLHRWSGGDGVRVRVGIRVKLGLGIFTWYDCAKYIRVRLGLG